MANSLYLLSRHEGPDEVLFGYASCEFESTHEVPETYYLSEEFFIPPIAPYHEDFKKFFFTHINNFFVVENHTLKPREVDYWSFDVRPYADGTPSFVNVRFTSGVLKTLSYTTEITNFAHERYPNEFRSTIWTWDDVEFTTGLWMQEFMSRKAMPYLSTGRELPQYLRDMQNLLLDMKDNFSNPNAAIDAMRAGPEGLAKRFNINWK
jgi:hypothetical protein